MKKKIISIILGILCVIPFGVMASSYTTSTDYGNVTDVVINNIGQLKEFLDDEGVNYSVSGNTITLNADTTFSSGYGISIPSGDEKLELTLNLNGHSIAGLPEIRIDNRNNKQKEVIINVDGTKENSKINGTVFICRENCELNINGGKYTNDDDRVLYFDYDGKGTIKNSQIIQQSSQVYHAIEHASTGYLEIFDTNTTCSGNCYDLKNNSKTVINGGKVISATGFAIKAYENALVTINGGYYTANAGTYSINFFGSSKVIINNGTFEVAGIVGADNGIIEINDANMTTQGGTIFLYGNSKGTIKRGSFESQNYAPVIQLSNNSILDIQGGSYVSKGVNISTDSSSQLNIANGRFENREEGKYLINTSGSSSIKATGGTFAPKGNKVAVAEEQSKISLINTTIITPGTPEYAGKENITIKKEEIDKKDNNKSDDKVDTKTDNKNTSKNETKTSEKGNPDTGAVLSIGICIIGILGIGTTYYLNKKKKFLKF